jgi:hypothetical protein
MRGLPHRSAAQRWAGDRSDLGVRDVSEGGWDMKTTAIEGYAIGIDPSIPSTIVFHSVEGGEMLKIARDGFYVRGEKVPQGGDEARTVYDAFVSWLRTTGRNV